MKRINQFFALTVIVVVSVSTHGQGEPELDYYDYPGYGIQPSLVLINANHAYLRRAAGTGIRIAIEDDGVDILNSEFAGRIQYEGASLTYWRPLGRQAYNDCVNRYQLGLQEERCFAFKIDAGGDEQKIQDYARYLIEKYGYPTKDDTWFIQDTSQSDDSLAWDEIPALYEPGREHGTAVASVAAGWLLGVAPRAAIIPIAVNFDEQDETREHWGEILQDVEQSRKSSDQSYADEIDLFLANSHNERYANFDIINQSYGIGADGFSHLELAEFESWVETNLPEYWRAYTQQDAAEKTIAVWAAGNDGLPTPSADAAFPYREASVRGHVIAVAAADIFGRIAPYSNRCGRLPADWNTASHGRHYCLTAPGTVTVAIPDFWPYDGRTPYVKNVAGTSFAAPMVAGALAVVMDRFRGQLDNQEVALRIINTANNRGIYSDDLTYGAGMLDLAAATESIGIVRTGTASLRAPMTNTQLQTPASWGDVGGRLQGVEVAGFDDWNAPFWYSADALVTPSRLHHQMVPFPDRDVTFEQTALLPHLHWFNVGGNEEQGRNEGMKLRIATLQRYSGQSDSFAPESSYHTFGFSGEVLQDIRVGFLVETRANQSAFVDGAFGTSTNSQLVWLSREHSWNLQSEGRLKLRLAYLLAAGYPDYENGAMFAASGSLYSSASLSLEQQDELSQTRLTIEQPLRAESGTGTLRYATGRNKQGEWQYARTRFSLVPETREIRLRLRHDRSLGAGKLAVEATYAHNAGHVAGRSHTHLGLGYHLQW